MRKRCLTDEDIFNIRKMYILGRSTFKIAKQYNVSYDVINCVVYRKGAYKNVI